MWSRRVFGFSSRALRDFLRAASPSRVRRPFRSILSSTVGHQHELRRERRRRHDRERPVAPRAVSVSVSVSVRARLRSLRARPGPRASRRRRRRGLPLHSGWRRAFRPSSARRGRHFSAGSSFATFGFGTGRRVARQGGAISPRRVRGGSRAPLRRLVSPARASFFAPLRRFLLRRLRPFRPLRVAFPRAGGARGGRSRGFFHRRRRRLLRRRHVRAGGNLARDAAKVAGVRLQRPVAVAARARASGTASARGSALPAGMRALGEKHHAGAVDDVGLDAAHVHHAAHVSHANHVVVTRTSNLRIRWGWRGGSEGEKGCQWGRVRGRVDRASRAGGATREEPRGRVGVGPRSGRANCLADQSRRASVETCGTRRAPRWKTSEARDAATRRAATREVARGRPRPIRGRRDTRERFPRTDARLARRRRPALGSAER